MRSKTAPARCFMAQQTTGRAQGGSSSRSALSQQRPRSFALFSEGEDGSPVVSASAESSSEAAGEAGVEEEQPMSEAEMAQRAKMAEIERLRAKEKFITAKTGACLNEPSAEMWDLWGGGRVCYSFLSPAGKHETPRGVGCEVRLLALESFGAGNTAIRKILGSSVAHAKTFNSRSIWPLPPPRCSLLCPHIRPRVLRCVS